MTQTEMDTVLHDLLKQKFKKIQSTQPDKYIEVYPHWAKQISELKEYCDRKVKSGEGVWTEPVKGDTKTIIGCDPAYEGAETTVTIDEQGLYQWGDVTTETGRTDDL